jgi:glycosyltransferase involved in cell wall biosynthesis
MTAAEGTSAPAARRLPLSVFIITRDEEDRLGAAIDSVTGWADEVIVVDSGSTDGTVALAGRLGARVLHHDWHGYGLQKRFAEDQCRNAWLLNLDADERVTPELRAEIEALFALGEPPLAGYRIYIRQIYAHETRPSRWAMTYDPVRLYDRRAGRYSDSPVHDRVVLDERRVGRLRHCMTHFSIRSLAHLVDKHNKYTSALAEDYVARGRRLNPLRLLIEFPLAFFKAYVFRRRMFMGFHGLALAMTFAYFRFMRLAKIYELQRRR